MQLIIRDLIYRSPLISFAKLINCTIDIIFIYNYRVNYFKSESIFLDKTSMGYIIFIILKIA